MWVACGVLVGTVLAKCHLPAAGRCPRAPLGRLLRGPWAAVVPKCYLPAAGRCQKAPLGGPCGFLGAHSCPNAIFRWPEDSIWAIDESFQSEQGGRREEGGGREEGTGRREEGGRKEGRKRDCWVLLGGPWGLLGSSWVLPGAPWVLLGSPWVLLGRLLWGLGAPSGSHFLCTRAEVFQQEKAKERDNLQQKTKTSQMLLWPTFWGHYFGFYT